MSTTSDLMGLGMSPALAARLGNTPASISGVGTAQTGAGAINGPMTLATPTVGNTAFVLANTISTGRPVWVWNQSSTITALVFPPSGGKINNGSANASVSIPPLTGAVFQLGNGAGVSVENWGAIIGGAGQPNPAPLRRSRTHPGNSCWPPLRCPDRSNFPWPHRGET